MKIVAIVPTYQRRSAGKVAKAISGLVDQVLIIDQDATIDTDLPNNVDIIHKSHKIYTDYGLCSARNEGYEFCREVKADLMFQVDDDIYFPADTIKAMINIMKKNKRIGAVSSDPSVLAYWSKDLVTNQPYKISGTASQLWAVRMEAAEEVANGFREECFMYETMEDIRFSMKLWTLGWPVVRLHGNPIGYHQPFIARLNKSDTQGGQSISVRDYWLPIAIEHMQDFVGPDKVMKFCKLGQKPGGQLSYRLQYNFPVMTANSISRHGKIGYKDNKERVL